MEKILFKCDWYDVHTCNSGTKVDQYGFTLMNISIFSESNELYVLATRVQQVLYVEDLIEKVGILL